MCAAVQNGVKYIDEPLMHYRIHSSNLSIKANTSVFNKLCTLFNGQKSIKTEAEYNIMKMAIAHLKGKVLDDKFYELCSNYIRPYKSYRLKAFVYHMKLRKYVYPHVHEAKKIVLAIINFAAR